MRGVYNLLMYSEIDLSILQYPTSSLVRQYHCISCSIHLDLQPNTTRSRILLFSFTMSENPNAGSEMTLFEQHGELNWMEMYNSFFSATTLAARRIAMGEITQNTFEAGLIMSTRFRFGLVGRSRVSDAAEQHRAYFGFDRFLWFAIGHQSFLSILKKHEVGLQCAALCASLAETYGLDRAAQLLQALWRVLELSEFLSPARSQFRALASACSGLLVGTDFSKKIKDFRGRLREDDQDKSARCEDWAKAVDAIFQISKGNLQAVKVYGRDDLAYLAAIACWFFDLKVCLQRPNGRMLFENCSNPEDADIHFFQVHEYRSKALIQVSTTTFILRSIRDLISDDAGSYPMHCRVPWGSCFADLFPRKATNMLSESILLGRACGAVARMYKALNYCEDNVGGLSRTHFTSFRPAGYGAGFVDNVCELFPEITLTGAFRRAAVEILDMDVSTSTQILVESIIALKKRCPCPECKGQRDDSWESTSIRQCNITVFGFIRTAASIMAHLDLKMSINPSLFGLWSICLACEEEWRGLNLKRQSRLLELATGLPHAGSAGKLRKRRKPRQSLFGDIFKKAVELFTGESCLDESGRNLYSRMGPQCTAIVRNGVCLWIGALESITSDPASIATIHVAPGHITYKDWSYTSIWDLSHAEMQWFSGLPSVTFYETATTSLREGQSEPNHVLRMLAEEKASNGTIKLAYGLESETIQRRLQPGIITEEILIATARVPCARNATCSNELVVPCWQRKSGWECADLIRDGAVELRNGARGLTKTLPTCPSGWPLRGGVWNVPSPLHKLLAIEGCRTDTTSNYMGRAGSTVILLRSHQCMACMTRYLTTFREKAEWEQRRYYPGDKPRKGINVDEPRDCFVHIISTDPGQGQMILGRYGIQDYEIEALQQR